MSIKNCTFNSVWDGGFTISTKASVDTETGRVFDIEPTDPFDDDGAEVETLDREYVDFDGIVGEFDVARPEAGADFHVADPVALRAALEDGAAPTP
jgi:hypothetical protein